MLTAAWIFLIVCAVINGLKSAVKLSEEAVGMGILHAAEAAFCGFAAHAVWQVS